MFPLRKKIEDSDNYAAMLGLSALKFEEARTCLKIGDSLHGVSRVPSRHILCSTCPLSAVLLENLNGRLEIVAQSKPSGFNMKFCMDESPERRFIGVVTGVGDMDPYEWSNSKRRFIMVRWDEDIGNDHQERISPWDIDLSGGSFPLLNIQSSPRFKKLRARMHATPFYLPAAGRNFS
ncbi:auxin response factor 4-like protein [Tanacetum coccineum]